MLCIYLWRRRRFGRLHLRRAALWVLIRCTGAMSDLRGLSVCVLKQNKRPGTALTPVFLGILFWTRIMGYAGPNLIIRLALAFPNCG